MDSMRSNVHAMGLAAFGFSGTWFIIGVESMVENNNMNYRICIYELDKLNGDIKIAPRLI